MIDEKELQALFQYEKGPVLSVYLDTDLSDKSKEAVRLTFRNLARDLQASRGDAKLLAKEIESVQNWLNFEYDWQSRGVALFISDGDLWQVFPLPIAVRSRLYYTERPYVRPLTDVADRLGEYAVALIDRESLRLFSVAWGKIRAETEAVGEELKRHKQGGWAAARYQRHEDNLALHNLKHAVEVIQAFCEQRNCRRLMLGGSPEVLAQVKELMPYALRERVIGEFAVDIEASANEVLIRSLDVAQQVDAEEEHKLVAEAITAAAKGANGVTGLADTLYELHQGRVQVLLVEEDYHAPGFVCTHCGYVAAQPAEACAFCQSTEIEETPDVVNLAIHKAIETGADVNIVRENEALRAAGGIAAILRY
ncbi:MAG: hypothetical protein H5T69_06460 [Chloroflexi bacterium]|nr:hypothetical protein [Chloroflexota bacterium]